MRRRRTGVLGTAERGGGARAEGRVPGGACEGEDGVRGVVRAADLALGGEREREREREARAGEEESDGEADRSESVPGVEAQREGGRDQFRLD